MTELVFHQVVPVVYIVLVVLCVYLMLKDIWDDRKRRRGK